MTTIKLYYQKSFFGLFSYISKSDLAEWKKQILNELSKNKICTTNITVVFIPSVMDRQDKILIEVHIKEVNTSLTEKQEILETALEESKIWFNGSTVRVQLATSMMLEKFV